MQTNNCVGSEKSFIQDNAYQGEVIDKKKYNLAKDLIVVVFYFIFTGCPAS